MSQENLNILIAEDSPSDRLLLQSLLHRQGHSVTAVENGRQAVESYRAHPPDLVLLDVMMPEMDGIEAARQMRALDGVALIPIIFLTSLNKAQDLAACLAAGGDDFITKPYNPVILAAKIQAFDRLRRLHAEVMGQREHLIAEQQAAKLIFDRIIRLGALDAPCIRYLMSPMAIFDGDVLLAARQPDGDMLVLLGDFTGHGLPAAIGIMPLAEIFYGMGAKGFGLEAILREINSRLKAVLPPSVFCCATAAHINYGDRYYEIWAGGLPDGVIHNRRSRSLTRIPSTHVPLGILPAHRFEYRPLMLELEEGSDLYLWSDGIIEAPDASGEMFGEERLLALFDTQPDDMFSHITTSLRDFTGTDRQSDDYSLVAVCPEKDVLPLSRHNRVRFPAYSPGHWSLDYEIHAESMQTQDPVPLLMHMLMQVPGLRAHGSAIGTILSELYANALEHGLLGLSSSLKQDADGFRRYYRLRSERLHALDETASIRIHLEVEPLEHGGLLRVRMQDSGPGFDFSNPDAGGGLPGYYGRGLRLLASLCRRVEYFPPGNDVLVEFSWQD
ncbi:MAG: fused response regulator/phosphatase [Moraxellaceae bacterium]|jgi:CheY-like chemotaxis protein/anti-sigma regulatory factor (Ser/Thr protein kinase)|nr:fused response regulator/phosphatase [Moraxellaceae bacterium]